MPSAVGDVVAARHNHHGLPGGEVGAGAAAEPVAAGRHRADVPPLVVIPVEDESVARVLAAGRAPRHEEGILETGA